MRSRIGLAALAVVVLGAACNIFGAGGQGRIERTRTDLLVIEGAATLYVVRNGGRCPSSVADLVEDGQLSGSARTADAWGTDFSVECEPPSDPVVVSAGPDRTIGTEDDLRSSRGD